MDIIIGSGKNRQAITLPQGREYRQLAKNDPIEHTKIKGNVMALVRQQPKIKVKPGLMAKKMGCSNEPA